MLTRRLPPARSTSARFSPGCFGHFSPVRFRLRLAAATLVAAVPHLAFAPAALAQAIEEIVVSADYRETALADVPGSVSVLGEELLQQRSAQHLEDVLLMAPNVNFASGASRARFYQIRGIGERAQYHEPLNPSVGLIIDGVDFSGIGNAALLYDVEQVEVLLGPQGTRYGSNALAGLINLQSKAPTEDFRYGLRAEAANQDGRGLAGYVSGPLSDTLLYRVSAQNTQSDGPGHNAFLDRATNFRDESSVRGRLRWLPAEDLRLDLTAALMDVDNGYDGFTLDSSRTSLADEPGFDRQRSELLSARLTLDGFEALRVEALASAARSDIGYGYDEDWLYVGYHPDEYSATDAFYRDQSNRSAELRLLSKEAGRLLGGRSDWVLGVYARQQDTDLRRVYTWLDGDFLSRHGMDRLALFAETNTRLGESWSLDLGLRAERFESSYLDTDGLDFAPDDDLFGGKLALNYRTGNGALLYASVARGYKTGGFNTDGSLDADLRLFDAELLWNYELGFKGGLLNDALQVRAALFTMEREDVQVSSSQSRLRADGSTEFIQYVGNAATGRNSGLELGLDWLLSERLRLDGSLGLLETRYEDFVNSAGENLDGREQAHAPSWNYSLGAEFLLLPELSLHLGLQGRDDFYFSDSHSVRGGGFHQLHSSVDYRRGQWRFTLWGRNLTGEDYGVRGFWFGNDPRKGYVDEAYLQLGEPRRFGLTVNYDL